MKKCPKSYTIFFYFVLWNNCFCEYLDVKINQGLVRGYNSDEQEVFSFYGIPYATVPKGVNKFQGPLPPPTWTDIFNATERYTICLQQDLNSDTYYKYKRKLQCLIINVFKPTDGVNLPVFVNIHGGALVNGYGMTLSPIALSKKGIITVTFNYRVGVLGFMCLGTEKVPGNAGMKDQVAALKWVQQNIKHFGGDPNRVTIAGCSSAATTNEALVISSTTKGLFSQAVLESGSLLHIDLVTTDHLQLAIDQARSLGARCNNTKEVEDFYTLLEDEAFNAHMATPPFLPCVEANLNNGEERFLVEAPVDTLINGNFNKVPLIIAIAPKEGMCRLELFEESKTSMANNISQYLPSNLKYKTEKEKEETIKSIKNFYFPSGEITKMGYIDFFTDIYFIYPLYVFSRLNSRSKTSDVFMYLFSFRGSIALPGVDLSIGQGHIAESLYYLEYVIWTIYDNITDKDREMRERLRQYYSHFIKYGNPNLNDTTQGEWLPFKEDDFYYLDINDVDTLRQNPMQERFEFWNKIYDKQFNLSRSKPEPNKISATTILIIFSLILAVVLVVLFLVIRCKSKSAFQRVSTENELS